MRLKEAVENGPKYVEYILNVGEGKEPTDSNQRITLPHTYLHHSKELNKLLLFVYGDNISTLSYEELVLRAIITPLNKMYMK